MKIHGTSGAGLVAVTGGHGFIGSHLVAALAARGDPAIVLSRRTQRSAPPGVREVFVDFDDVPDGARLTNELSDVSTLVHLASDVSWASELSAAGLSAFRRNVVNPIRLLGCIPNLRRVVVGSSIMVYPAVAAAPLCEERDEAPETFYGVDKLVLEDAARWWASKTGTSWASARIGQVFGPGMRVNRFLLDALRAGHHGDDITVYGDGSPTADWIWVDDVVEALFLLLFSDIEGPVNVARGIGRSNLDIAKAASKVGGAGSRIVFDTKKPVAPRRQVADTSKCRTLLSFEARTDLEQGMTQMLAVERKCLP